MSRRLNFSRSSCYHLKIVASLICARIPFTESICFLSSTLSMSYWFFLSFTLKQMKSSCTVNLELDWDLFYRPVKHSKRTSTTNNRTGLRWFHTFHSSTQSHEVRRAEHLRAVTVFLSHSNDNLTTSDEYEEDNWSLISVPCAVHWPCCGMSASKARNCRIKNSNNDHHRVSIVGTTSASSFSG